MQTRLGLRVGKRAERPEADVGKTPADPVYQLKTIDSPVSAIATDAFGTDDAPVKDRMAVKTPLVKPKTDTKSGKRTSIQPSTRTMQKTQKKGTTRNQQRTILESFVGQRTAANNAESNEAVNDQHEKAAEGECGVKRVAVGSDNVPSGGNKKQRILDTDTEERVDKQSQPVLATSDDTKRDTPSLDGERQAKKQRIETEADITPPIHNTTASIPSDAKAQDAKVQDIKVQDIKAQDAKALDAKVQDIKAPDTASQAAKEQDINDAGSTTSPMPAASVTTTELEHSHTSTAAHVSPPTPKTAVVKTAKSNVQEKVVWRQVLFESDQERIADERRTLERLRSALDISLTFHSGHQRIALFHKIQPMLRNSTQKNITLSHLAKILYLAPDLYHVELKALRESGTTFEAYALEFGRNWTPPLTGKQLEERAAILSRKLAEYFEKHPEDHATVPEKELPKMEKVIDKKQWLENANLPSGVRELLELQEKRAQEAKEPKGPRPTPTGTVRERGKALLERIRAKANKK